MHPSLIQKLSSLYPQLGKVSKTNKILAGFLSENYEIVADGGRFFLKQYRFDTADKIIQIQSSKKFFFQGGAPVILPISSTQGTTYFQHNDKFYSLFPFVLGNTLEHGRESSRTLKSIASLLAKMHHHSQVHKPALNLKYIQNWNRESFLEKSAQIQSLISDIPYKSHFDMLALNTIKLRRQIVSININDIDDFKLEPQILIHGDFHGKNLFVDDRQQIASIFDFEKTEYSPRVLELLRSMYIICLHGNYTKQNISNANYYLQQYSMVNQINPDEIIRGKQVFYLKLAHSLWIETEHYLNQNNRVDCFLENEFATLSNQEYWLRLGRW